MTHREPPHVGCALVVSELATHRDWIIAGQRDLELQDPCWPELLDGDYRALARQARDLLDGYTGRAGIHGPFDGMTIASRDPRLRALTAERLKQAIEFASEAGATNHMVIHSPFLPLGTPFAAYGAGGYRDELVGFAHATLAEVLPLAEQAGMTLVIENIFDTNPEHLLMLVRSFGRDSVRMSLDTGHAQITSGRGGPPPSAWVLAAGELLGHVHLQDADVHADRHWPPGDGQVSWAGVFDGLGTLPQRPRLILELRDHQSIPRGAAYLAQRGFVR